MYDGAALPAADALHPVGITTNGPAIIEREIGPKIDVEGVMPELSARNISMRG